MFPLVGSRDGIQFRGTYLNIYFLVQFLAHLFKGTIVITLDEPFSGQFKLLCRLCIFYLLLADAKVQFNWWNFELLKKFKEFKEILYAGDNLFWLISEPVFVYFQKGDSCHH